jgi:adenylylsulfate kinase
MLVILAGLPASGKSTLARAIAGRLGGAVLDKDVIRRSLFASPDDIEYSAEQDDFVMDAMLQTARYLIGKNPARVVFLDGRTFSQDYQRRRAIDFAAGVGAGWKLIECVCSEASARARLLEDERTGTHPAGNRTWELYERVRASFEAIRETKIVIDTDEPLEHCVDAALGYLAI